MYSFQHLVLTAASAVMMPLASRSKSLDPSIHPSIFESTPHLYYPSPTHLTFPYFHAFTLCAWRSASWLSSLSMVCRHSYYLRIESLLLLYYQTINLFASFWLNNHDEWANNPHPHVSGKKQLRCWCEISLISDAWLLDPNDDDKRHVQDPLDTFLFGSSRQLPNDVSYQRLSSFWRWQITSNTIIQCIKVSGSFWKGWIHSRILWNSDARASKFWIQSTMTNLDDII